MPSNVADRLARVASTQTLKLTHQGRKSGKPYDVTIWFVVDGAGRMFLPTANRNRNWVKNVTRTPHISLAIGEEVFHGAATPLVDEKDRGHVRALLNRKYWYAAPIMSIARVVVATGLATDHSAAFEVKLDDA
jgi:deazaflavin-dependent oxidoreductase (nitroreductase family)